MKRILLISMLSLFPLYSNAQYNVNFGDSTLKNTVLSVAPDQYGISCTDPNHGKHLENNKSGFPLGNLFFDQA